MGIEVGGMLGPLILIANCWAIYNVFSSRASMAAEVGWTVLILVLPVVGLIIWLLLGPRSRASTAIV